MVYEETGLAWTANLTFTWAKTTLEEKLRTVSRVRQNICSYRSQEGRLETFFPSNLYFWFWQPLRFPLRRSPTLIWVLARCWLPCLEDAVQFSVHFVCISLLMSVLMLCQMSLRELLKMLGLGAVVLALGVEGLDRLTRRLWLRRGMPGPLKEVLFFPSAITCVEHLYSPARGFQW